MKAWKVAASTIGAVGAASLLYGLFVESKKLVMERRELWLPDWPRRLDGYTIALLADFHLRDKYSLELAQRSVEMALDASPDMIAIAGDFVGYWKHESAELLWQALEPLSQMQGRAVAVPGNHDYWLGDPAWLAPILDEFDIRLLRNEAWQHDGISWIGIDSVNAGKADPFKAMWRLKRGPAVALWHEPDLVRFLPDGASLMLSGHSHGGQYRWPWGSAPMHTANGKRYTHGFYLHAPTPLYVTRGIGTTGPPSRFLCAPEVSLLTLRSRE